jgi:hypothetical protein
MVKQIITSSSLASIKVLHNVRQDSWDIRYVLRVSTSMDHCAGEVSLDLDTSLHLLTLDDT